ncbi:MAG: hypothetical protein GC179_20265 [Anaerolineaceae bacterium]|nr:hypothetical protein [Anaerolineaceae bacterium]
MPHNKMERFTQRARRVLSLAQEEAERLHHKYIGTEHMLLGLFREDGGVAGRVLRELGLEYSRVEELVEELTRVTAQTTATTAELSPGTKRVLELAVDEARRMGHHYIGTEHLLLGLVRQLEGVAIEVLKRLGISPEDVRRQTRRVLQESPVQNQSPTASPTEKLVAESSISETGLQVLTFAREYVDQFQLITVDPEHLLVGLLREEKGIAGQVLRDLGLELKRVEELVQELTQAAPRTTPTHPELSQRTKELLELAVDDARNAGERHIDTHHMLMGLLRQSESVALDVLNRLGIKHQDVRRQINLKLQKPSDTQSFPNLPARRPEREVQYIGAGSMYLMESLLKKMLDMVGDGKLTVEQVNEMLATLQPGLKLNTGMQAWLATLVNQREAQDKRRVRVVVINRETQEELFKLTLSLLEGLEKLDQLLLATVTDNQLKSVAFDSDSSSFRVEVHVENDEDKADE